MLEWVFPLSPYHPTLLPTAVGVGAAPVVLTAVGFTGTGIAAASIAAKMMSAAAIANGGGVAAGSLVAALQSAGVSLDCLHQPT
ncbi:Interferon alpha-inducible protein 27-like protein 2A [Lemmus lemmus]